jgi:tetracycline 7-halogenase / FADH2 O2-dependent halogenase
VNTTTHGLAASVSSSDPREHIVAEVLFTSATTTNILSAILIARRGGSVAVAGVSRRQLHQPAAQTIPQSGIFFDVLADEYRVPELRALGRHAVAVQEIGSSTARKRHITFAYHEKSGTDRQRVLRFNLPGEHSDSHIRWGHLDDFLLKVANQYGVVLVLDDIATIHVVAGGGVASVTSRNQKISSSIVVTPSDVDSDTRRTVSAQFVRVRSIADLSTQMGFMGSAPWTEGTVHHIFPGGFAWVAPLGAQYSNGTLVVDCGVSIDAGHDLARGEPAEVFRAAVSQSPDLRHIFADVCAVSPWFDSLAHAPKSHSIQPDPPCDFDLEQLSNQRWSDPGWIVEGGRVSELRDPLFSVGLCAIARDADLIADRLVAHSKGTREALNALQTGLKRSEADALRFLDAAYAATNNARLWDAIARTWLLSSITETIAVRARLRTKSPRSRAGSQPLRIEHLSRVPAMISSLIDQTVLDCEAIRNASLTPEQAADQIFARLAKSPAAPPFFAFGDEACRFYRLTPRAAVATFRWYLNAPVQLKAMIRGRDA